MKKQEIMDLLDKSPFELKNILIIKDINVKEFSRNIEDMKVSAISGSNSSGRILFNELSVLKGLVLDILSEQSKKEVKPCNETKFRLALQFMLL